MLQSHVKFHSTNGKRLIMVVDDELINRELMGIILQDEYELIFAADGEEAIDLIRANQDTLSLVLLDLMMPHVSGKEVLQHIQDDPQTRHIPVIVLTADKNAEVEILNLGAVDFIPKPYPDAGVIRARILRTIELSEDRQIIQSTERDPLTGLYNREYFYRYAEQYDLHHKSIDMDAIVVDVNHFHMINERFGTSYGDEVLRRIGEKLREAVADSGGIVCRRQADTFMVYCPHRTDYQAVLARAYIGLTGDNAVKSRIRLRMGVYAMVDKGLEVERRFDRAKMAADTVRNSFTRTIALYDQTLHERELYAEQLIEDFPEAIKNRQFEVFYQPKFDVRPEIPVLASAEALVRWFHPTLGMISPGIFIPLFEDNGLIQMLDNYVWETTAAQIRSWKDRFDFSVPVSVNVSRIDMYDPDLIGTFKKILADNQLTPSDLYLEITESAYTQDSERIIAVVGELRSLGFFIEMDDFGTGYSSLNMISKLPIDALKLDMQFIRTAFGEQRDTRMIEVIIDIADYLTVPVIAEGVETAEQLDALKAMGCDLVQGYYFSRPIPTGEYEEFMLAHKEHSETAGVLGEPSSPSRQMSRHDAAFGPIAYALSSDYESVYYVDIDSNHYVEFGSGGAYADLQIERSGVDFFADTVESVPRVVYEPDRERVLLNMQKETLLEQLMGERPFTMTYRLVIDGTPTYYTLKAVRVSTHDNHHIVVGVSDVHALVEQAQGQDRDRVDFNSLATVLSSDMESIFYVDLHTGAYLEFESERSTDVLTSRSEGDNFFADLRTGIKRLVHAEDQARLAQALQRDTLAAALREHRTFMMDYRLLVGDSSLYYRVKAIPAVGGDGEHIIIGVSNVDAQVRREEEYGRALRLARDAAYRDALTGVKSKLAYTEAEIEQNRRIANGTCEPFAVVMCDVNDLKAINDTQGHDVGDECLRAACREICQIFTHSPVYRFGGDEFVVLLRGHDYEQRAELMARIMNVSLDHLHDGGTVIASGISEFAPAEDGSLSCVFRRADAAMYENKRSLKALSSPRS